ncbi:hypothetical protein DV515_00014830 [Chloebia gouldiae]|uniref:C2 domain-containing protein n=1 Tax=Chloebia gouldiae TaxID=44316 RepID=A0A3L8RX39_CHLGU|nr:hypothetical protein DV515_00014830 [Chloebia gouldiae]
MPGPGVAVEVPAGLTGRKEPAAAALPSMSQPIPVQITVVSAQNLKTLKSNVLATLVRVEYNGAVLGDSSKTDVLPDGTAEYDFSTSFECSPDGPNSLDVLVQKPLLLTVLEVMPKEKKKPETITPLGQAVVDLLPLLQGVRSLKVFAPLYAVPASPSASLHPEATVCGIWNCSFPHSALCCFLMGGRT